MNSAHEWIKILGSWVWGWGLLLSGVVVRETRRYFSKEDA
jgi:hypothetical protein